MSWLDDPDNLTRLITLITAIAAAITAYLAKTTKTVAVAANVTAVATQDAVSDVHTLVDGRLDMVLNRVQRLEDLLDTHNIPIPASDASTDLPMVHKAEPEIGDKHG